MNIPDYDPTLTDDGSWDDNRHLSMLLRQYARDTEHPDFAYAVANKYEAMGQTASAITFFMKCAERTKNDVQAYECLLHMALCYNKQGNRNHTVLTLLKHAITVCPHRPEAYFLISRQYERTGKYVDGYLWANLGLSNLILLPNWKPLHSDVEYTTYGLLFEKAVCAWWWGRADEARLLFQELMDIPMDEEHTKAAERNVRFLGAGPNTDKDGSQVGQDEFVLKCLNNKRDGIFLEVGGGVPKRGNNTWLLESQYGWKGTSIEINHEFVLQYHNERPTTNVICGDALGVDYTKEQAYIAPDGIIDYLSLDLEPCSVTYEALLKINFETHKFRVITYEHDYYTDITRSFRDKSRVYLQSKGYTLVVPDVKANDWAVFEDWYVNKNLVDSNAHSIS